MVLNTEWVRQVSCEAHPTHASILKQRHSRYWEVRDPQDDLVCITVYKKGAAEAVRRLAA